MSLRPYPKPVSHRRLDFRRRNHAAESDREDRRRAVAGGDRVGGFQQPGRRRTAVRPEAGIPSAVIERKAFAGQEEFSRAIFDRCRQARADLVVMGGFLKRVTIPDDFANRVINIHPALVPAFCGEGFYGHRVHEAVLEYGAKLSGCTVHFADNQYDHGPVILQRAVPVLDDDTPETLAARVFAGRVRGLSRGDPPDRRRPGVGRRAGGCGSST